MLNKKLFIKIIFGVITAIIINGCLKATLNTPNQNELTTEIYNYTWFNATGKCDTSCDDPTQAEAWATLRYNSSGTTPNEGVNISAGTPFNIIKVFGAAPESEWNRTYNPGAGDIAYGVAVDSVKDIYVVGYETQTDADWRVMKLNKYGISQWNRTYSITNGDQANSMAVDSSDNLYIVGDQDDSANIRVQKLNTTGHSLWNKTYNPGTSDLAYGVAVDSVDDIYVAGKKTVSGTNSDWYIMKLNSTGHSSWNRSYNFGGLFSTDYANDIAIDSSDNIYFGGRRQDINLEGQIMKLNTTGHNLWNRTYSPAGSDSKGIAVDSSGNVYVVGSGVSVMKFDSDDVSLWNKTFGSTTLLDIVINSNDDIYAVGDSGGVDWKVMKLNTTGHSLFNRTYNIGTTDIAYDVAIDSVDDLYVVGMNGSADWFVMKLAVLNNPAYCGNNQTNISLCDIRFQVNATALNTSILDVLFNTSDSGVTNDNSADVNITVSDLTSPLFSSGKDNSTSKEPLSGETINLSLGVQDHWDLDYIIYSTNDSGSWANSTASQPSISTGNYTNWTTETVDTAKGINVGWQIFANDSSSNIAGSGIKTFIVKTDAPTFSSGKDNSTTYEPIKGQIINLSMGVQDDSDLDYIIYSTNDSGSFVNSTPSQPDVTTANYTNWTTESVDTTFGVVGWQIFANDTSGFVNGSVINTFTVKDPGTLNVSLQNPVPDTKISSALYNYTWFNATINCTSGSSGCSDVQGTLRYNDTGNIPNKAVNITTGDTPIYIISVYGKTLANPANCDTLSENENCVLKFKLNGTALGTRQLDVLFNSSNSYVTDNDTKNVNLTITGAVSVGATISTNLSSGVDFIVSSVPQTNLSAAGNNGVSGITLYNVTIDATSTTADLYIKTDGNLTTAGGDSINLTNEKISYSTTDNTVPSSNKSSLTTSYTDNPIGSNLEDGTVVYLKFYLNVSGAQAPGTYTNTVTVKVVAHGNSP